jgi:hypothetical protein
MRQTMYATPNWGVDLHPHRCEACGRTRMPSGLEMITQVSQMLFTPLMESLNQMVAGMPTSSRVSGKRCARSYNKAHKCDCGCHCDDCTRDECHCFCIIGDVDLVVYGRLGERRVVPIVVENSRRRERQIRLELSDWTTRSGEPTEKVSAQLRSPAEFTMRPCEERAVVIEMNATSEPGTPLPTDETEQRRLSDVDECEVYYADLRVMGCDIRPIRIALALLPRDCATYEAACRCGCC